MKQECEIQERTDLWKILPNPNSPIAEVGVAEGLFSKHMLEWWPYFQGKLYLVDKWETTKDQKGDGGFPQHWHNKNFEDVLELRNYFPTRIVILRGQSHLMASRIKSGSLSMVFIDADHSYEAVKKDIEAWFPRLMPRGVMAFHDFFNPAYDVAKAVLEFCYQTDRDIRFFPATKLEDAGAYIIC